MKPHHSNFLTRIFAAVLLAALFALSACASVGEPTHKFDFSPLQDSPQVRVLDWRYSEYGAPSWQVRQAKDDGKGVAGLSVTGRFPVGDQIYIKWQVPPSEQIHERRIDLKGLLPRSMEGCELRVIFGDAEPVVYLISPDKSEPSFRSFKGRGYSYQSIKQIYTSAAQ